MKLGTRAQARVKHDRLFYDCEVIDVDQRSITVRFFDDDDVQALPPAWVVAGKKKVIVDTARHEEPVAASSSGNVIVSQGWLWSGDLDARESFLPQTGAREARLLSFATCPKVYQSGTVTLYPSQRPSNSLRDMDFVLQKLMKYLPLSSRCNCAQRWLIRLDTPVRP